MDESHESEAKRIPGLLFAIFVLGAAAPLASPPTAFAAGTTASSEPYFTPIATFSCS